MVLSPRVLTPHYTSLRITLLYSPSHKRPCCTLMMTFSPGSTRSGGAWTPINTPRLSMLVHSHEPRVQTLQCPATLKRRWLVLDATNAGKCRSPPTRLVAKAQQAMIHTTLISKPDSTRSCKALLLLLLCLGFHQLGLIVGGIEPHSIYPP